MKKFFLFIAITLCSCSQKVDLIVHNAKIYTADSNFSIQSSIIVKNGLFIDVREDDNINVIETRYNEYLNSTEKVSNSYKQTHNSIFHELDGALQIEEITEKIKEILKKS